MTSQLIQISRIFLLAENETTTNLSFALIDWTEPNPNYEIPVYKVALIDMPTQVTRQQFQKVVEKYNSSDHKRIRYVIQSTRKESHLCKDGSVASLSRGELFFRTNGGWKSLLDTVHYEG